MKKYFLFLLCGLLSMWVYAQDPQFSQFYANPLYHNPAFAGREGVSRLILNYRMQWFNLGKGYKTPSISWDSYLDGTKVGIGGQAFYQWQDNNTQISQISTPISYYVNLSKRQEIPLYLRFALQPEWRTLTYNPLTYVDQLSSSGTITASNDPLVAGSLSKSKVGFSAGTLLEYGDDESNSSFWVGITWHHISHSIFKDMTTNKLPLSLDNQRIGIQAGVSIPLSLHIPLLEHGLGSDAKRVKNLKLTGYFRKQGPDMQLDIGTNFMYSPVILGLWYRGLPLQKYQGFIQQDALVFTLGFDFDNYLFQYSYDATISSLKSSLPGGTHEISMWILFDPIQVKFPRNKLTNCKVYR